MRQTAENTELVKSLIIKKAIEVFSAKGYSMTNMQDIAVAAQISRGPIYYHYKNRLILFNKAVQVHFEKAYADLVDIFSQDIPLIEKIRLDLVSCISHAVFSAMVEDTIDSMEKEDFSEARKIFQRYLSNAYQLKLANVQAALDAGELRANCSPSDVVDLIYVFYGGLRQWNRQIKELGRENDKKLSQEQAIDIMLRCIKSEFFAQ